MNMSKIINRSYCLAGDGWETMPIRLGATRLEIQAEIDAAKARKEHLRLFCVSLAARRLAGEQRKDNDR